MPAEPQSVTYRRHGATATLQLGRVADIFEAAALHRLALRALADTKAQTVRLGCADVERIDVSALQIIAALRRDLAARGRHLEVTGASEALTASLAQIGYDL